MRRLALIIVLTLCLSLPLVMSIIGYYNVPVSAAKDMVDSIPSLVVLDVRFLNEYNSGHIRNAKLIPVGELVGRLEELETSDLILVYCQSGGRSDTASQILAENGFGNIVNMLGGITAWIGAGYPVYIKYSSIQEAINTAEEGDVIFVSSGKYYENVIVNKTVTLIGENRDTTTIDANMSSGVKHSVIYISSSNVSVEGFTLKHCANGDGVSIQYGSHITISENLIEENEGRGIHVDHTSAGHINITGNIIFNNSIIGGWGAINLLASNNHVHKNIIDNHEVGILIQVNISNSTISENTIRNNNMGIYRHGGGTYDNLIYHNNFLNNTYQTDVEPTSNDTWDNGYEGNYWDNYNGTDSDGDGIGDIPYVIDSENTDNYPLMSPYWNPGDIDHDLDIDIYDIVKAAGIYGSTSLDPEWNPHCDIAEPYGVIDIFDLVMIANSYGEEYTP